MRLTGSVAPIVRDGKPAAVIVLAEQPSRQAEIGAEEIVQRVQEMCGVRLQVKRESEAASADKGKTRITLGRPGENKSLARPQEYQIEFARGDSGRVASLAGGDPLGLLYACVTFRYLLHETDDGVSAHEAAIRDWPDCRWRFTWSTLRDWQRIATGWDGKYPPARPKEGVAAAKAGLDWLLRHKINVFNSGHASAERGTLALRPPLPEVLHYAFERGIYGFTAGPGGNLGSAPPDKPRPELNVCFSYTYGDHIAYWCWSRDREMHARFDAAAKEIAACLPDDFAIGGMFIYLHTPDTGNMGWHKRCEQCRARFGNDQAAAQANLFNHFCDAVKRYVPQAKLVLVPRPYVGFNMDFPENRVYRDRLEKLAGLIPKGSYVVHVETTREAVESWKRLTPGLQLAHWVNGIGQPMGLDFRLNKTYQVDPQDAIFQGGPYEPSTLEVLGAAETMWNANAPGAAEVREDPRQPCHLEPWFDEGDKPEDMGRQKYAFSNELVGDIPKEKWLWLPPEEKAGPETWAFLRRTANEVYGEKASPLVLQVLASGLLDRYVDDPLAYPKYATPEAMAGQVRAYQAAATSAEKLWAERIEMKPGVFAGGVPLESLPRPAHTFGLGVNQVFGFCTYLAQARVWQPLLAARAALTAGKNEEAAARVAEAEKQLAAQAEMLRAAHARLDARKRYKAEVTPQLLANALKTIEGLKPKVDLVRAEVNLKTTIKRFADRPFAPHYRSGRMKVAVYVPPPDSGKVAGAVSLRDALAQDQQVEVSEIHGLDLGTLLRFDVLVFPACTQMPAADLARIPDVRRYVADFGGGLYAQHDSVGHSRFPLHGSMFPEVGTGADRLDSNRVAVGQKHDLVRGHNAGEIFEHMYYDHITIDVKGASGTSVLVDAETKAPVLVAGQVGRGRVVLDGSIVFVSLRTEDGKALAKKLGKENDFEHAAYGFSAEVLKNSIRWLCGVENW